MQSLDRLVRALRRLPGVGPRQAERFAAYFLRASQGEVEEFITSRNEKGAPVDEILLRDAINSFLEELQPETRIIFVRRYWYCSSIKSIAADYSISEGTVKSTLSRTRKRFREHLLKEGIDL